MVNYLFGFTFEINLFSLIAFLAGIFAGGAIFGLFYVFSCLKALNKKSIKINKMIENISEDDVKNIIHKYQESFEDEKKRRKSIPTDYFKTSIYEMINEIAGRFYPKSKRPILELSINELILLDRYILSKVEELMSHKGLALLKSLKVSTIMHLINTKNAVDNNKAVKVVKRYRLKQVVNVITSALNIINPYFWFKKLIITPTINVLINKICLICFSIVGEETYNVYSKQAFVEVDQKLKELLDSIDEEGAKLEDEKIEKQVKEKVEVEVIPPQLTNNYLETPKEKKKGWFKK